MYMVIVKKLCDTLPSERKQDAEKKQIYHATIVKKIGNIMYIFAYFFTKIFCKDIPQNTESGYPQVTKTTKRDKGSGEIFLQ